MRFNVAQRLDPGTAMGEILFGLIMTLTFTLAAGITISEEGRAGAKAMIIGILGCNLAWGLIDGVFYVLGQVFERGRLRRVVVSAARADSDEAGRKVFADELDELIAPLTDEQARRSLYDEMLQAARKPTLAPNKLRRADLIGGLAAGWLVFACSLPALVPFFVLLDQPRLALRISNAILIGLLFLVGHNHAQRYTFGRPWLTGLVFALIGLLLVGIAIPLGG